MIEALNDSEMLNNSDSISRQDAIDSMCELMHHWFGGDPKDEIREVKRELCKLPAVEPERKKGKWNFIGDNMFECTYCGVVYTTQQLNGLRNYDVDPYAPKFCPNCGADLRGEQDE